MFIAEYKDSDGVGYCQQYGTDVPVFKYITQHYNYVIMDTIASQITSLTIVYSTVYSDADQRKHQSSASLAFVRGIHHGPVTSPHKWPVTRKMSPLDDVIVKQHALLRLYGPCTRVCWRKCASRNWIKFKFKFFNVIPHIPSLSLFTIGRLLDPKPPPQSMLTCYQWDY